MATTMIQRLFTQGTKIVCVGRNYAAHAKELGNAVLKATIGFNGRPSNRAVVFRGFEENSDMIQINTDARSRKIQELKHCPFSEICWYFSDTWEQFRINGRIKVIDALNPDQSKLQI